VSVKDEPREHVRNDKIVESVSDGQGRCKNRSISEESLRGGRLAFGFNRTLLWSSVVEDGSFDDMEWMCGTFVGSEV
jgi:hypothetical protein